MKMPASGYMVYLLIDPRDLMPFYAGMTCRPHQRWNGHNADRGSAANRRLQELRRRSLKCRVRIVRLNLLREEARVLEKQVIETYRPMLLNGPLYKREAAA